ncbi:MAG TPA: glycosyltransferase, partial [Parasegetibacter sp.]
SVHEDPAAGLISSYGLKDNIHLLGFSSDIHSFYSFIDVVCFPSYYNAPGRPVFEGAWFGKPSILAVTDPKPDTFIPGVTGLQVTPGDVGAIVEAIKRFYLQEDLKTTLGTGALELAKENFDSKKNATAMLEIYREMLA